MNDDTNQNPDETSPDESGESDNPFGARSNPFANSPRITSSLPSIKPASESPAPERKLPSLSLPSLPRPDGSANPFARRPTEPPSPAAPTEQLETAPAEPSEEDEEAPEPEAPTPEASEPAESAPAESVPEIEDAAEHIEPDDPKTLEQEVEAAEDWDAGVAPEREVSEESGSGDGEAMGRDTLADLSPVESFMRQDPVERALDEDSTQHEIEVYPHPVELSEPADADEADSEDLPTDNVSPAEIASMMESQPNAFEPDPSWGTSDPSMETIDEIPLGALSGLAGDSTGLSGDTSAEDTGRAFEGGESALEGEAFEEDDFAEDATQIYVSGLNPTPAAPPSLTPSGPHPSPLPVPPSTSGRHPRPDPSVLGSGFHRQPSNAGRLPVAAPETSGTFPKPVLSSSGSHDRPTPSTSGFYPKPESPTTSGMHPRPAELSAPTPAAPADDLRDDDFAAQKTEILQSHFEEDEVIPRLIAIQGPVQGQEFFVSGLRATGGRGENNTLAIADMAMSRNHFEIIRNPDNSYLLRDLNSANGCFLNGTQIKEAAIFNGDRIEIGKSVLEFACAPAKAKPHRHLIPVVGVTLEGTSDLDDSTRMAALQIDQSTRLFTRITLIAGSVSLLLMFALILVIPKPSDGLSATSEPGAKASTRNAQDLFLKGVEAVGERDWDLAESFFKRAQSEDPSLPTAAQLGRVSREREAYKLLQEAQKLAAANKLLDAKERTDDIPAASVYHKEAQQLTRMQRIDEFSSLLQSAQQMLTNDELDGAREKVEQILKTSPGHTGAQELRDKIDTRAEELKALALAAEEAKKAATEKPDPFATPTPRPPEIIKVPANAGGSEAEALALYKKGNFSGAASAFESVGGKKGKSRAKGAREMNSNYRSGKSAYDGKQWSRAISKLTKAKRGDARAGGHYKRKISGMLATAHGKQGTALLRSKKYKEARAQLLKGRKLDRSNAELSGLSRSLESTATRLYIQAVNKKRTNTNAAMDLCRTIMRMVPSSSQSYKKAQRLFLEL